MALTTDLVSYYKCDDNLATTNVIDAVGTNAATATVNTLTLSETGLINTGLDLGGTDNIETFKIPTGDFSISFWINSTSFVNNARLLGSKQDSANYGFRIYVTSAGVMNVNVYDGTTSSAIVGSTALSIDEGFQHVVLTSDGSNGDTVLYLDNSSVGSDSTGAGYVQPTDTTVLKIGSSLSSDKFDGVFDEIGIFDKVLTSTEVSELYNSGDGLAYPFTTDVTVTPSTVTLSTTNDEPVYTIDVTLANMASSITLLGGNVFIPHKPDAVIGATGGKSTKAIRTAYPYEKGLTAGTTSQTGNISNLIPKRATTLIRQRMGF